MLDAHFFESLVLQALKKLFDVRNRPSNSIAIGGLQRCRKCAGIDAAVESRARNLSVFRDLLSAHGGDVIGHTKFPSKKIKPIMHKQLLLQFHVKHFNTRKIISQHYLE